MNNRQEFLEKLEKFKYENPDVLLGGQSDLNEETWQRPPGSSKRTTSTEACANGDTVYDADLDACAGKDGDCQQDSRVDMDCQSTGGQIRFDQTCI